MKLQYLYRNELGTSAVYNERLHQTKKVPISYINELCVENLSTYLGRKTATSEKYKVKSVVPIYVDDVTLLFPTESVKNFDCVWINYHEIETVYSDTVLMNNGHIVKCRKNALSKQLNKCFEIAFS